MVAGSGTTVTGALSAGMVTVSGPTGTGTLSAGAVTVSGPTGTGTLSAGAVTVSGPTGTGTPSAGTVTVSGPTGTGTPSAGTVTVSGPTGTGTPSAGTVTVSGFTGTMILARELFVARDLQSIYWASPKIIAEFTASQQIFDSIQALYLSSNTPRDRQIAERLTALYRAALDEDETIRPASISQFTEFFLTHPDLGFPRITLTPNGTIRARWIRGHGDFVAIEFTGKAEAKLVAEIPGLVPPMHFSRAPLTNIVGVVQSMGGSFA
jgi:hypothetical protein